MSGERLRLSVVIPCRNEARFIRTCLDSILASDYPVSHLEILVVDGLSDDGRRAIAAECAARHPVPPVVDNPQRTTPSGLNLGVRRASGDVIVRMDAHAGYPADYLSRLVAWLERSGADNVGGVLETQPGDDTVMARAIAVGVSHWFGVGNSYFRIGTREPRWVDTVPFGCFRREVFDRIGMFDEELVRSQDHEFNLRLIRSGGRILLAPDVVCRYYARETAAKLARTYFQYGVFRPLVARKLGATPTLRHTVPALFVAGVVGGGALAAWLPVVAVMLTLVLSAYATLAITASLGARRRLGARGSLALCLVFVTLHASLGAGFIVGLMRLLGKRRGAALAALPLSR